MNGWMRGAWPNCKVNTEDSNVADTCSQQSTEKYEVGPTDQPPTQQADRSSLLPDSMFPVTLPTRKNAVTRNKSREWKERRRKDNLAAIRWIRCNVLEQWAAYWELTGGVEQTANDMLWKTSGWTSNYLIYYHFKKINSIYKRCSAVFEAVRPRLGTSPLCQSKYLCVLRHVYNKLTP